MRSRLPWPLRWALAAVVLGFSGAIALWAFEFGRGIAGLDSGAQDELQRLRIEVERLQAERGQLRQIADTAESLLKAERAAQQGLAQQLRQAEAAREALRADLGFFERLLPSSGEGLQVRGVQASVDVPGQLRYQLLVVQNGKVSGDFEGAVDLVLGGTLAGRPWSQALRNGPLPLKLRQYTRLEGRIEHPAEAVIKTVEVRVTDKQGQLRATQSVKPMP